MSQERQRTVSIADPHLGERERTRVDEVLASGRLAAGDVVDGFEEAFADYCEADFAVATANGTAALHAALRASGIGDGDRVVTTPFSFVASANAIRLAGAEPVFADIDHETYAIDPHAVRAAVRDQDGDVDAVLAVHLYGLPAAMDQLREIAATHDLTLVEDACQAHGARFQGDPVGALGDVGCFSFYPTKNMTTGEGGMLVTDDEEIAERARRFVDHGRSAGYRHEELGHNYRMTNIAAAIGQVQLERLPEFTRARRENAARFDERLADMPVELPVEPVDRRHVYHQYTIRTSDRDRIRDALDAAGIDTGVYYPMAIHDQPAYAHVDATAPVAERAADEVLSLPVHPNVTEADVDAITRALARAFDDARSP